MAASVYNTPDNVVELLDRVLHTALNTRFYRSILGERRSIGSLSDFAGLPITPIAVLRRQALSDVVADPDRVGWIFGRYRGRTRTEVAVAEGADETALRYAIFRDALKDALPARQGRTGAVVTTPERRYFAAEIATMLGNVGVAAHVITYHDGARTADMLRSIQPDVLVPLLGDARDAALPPPGELCITVRRSPTPALAPGAGLKPAPTVSTLVPEAGSRPAPTVSAFARQMDLYMVDELGFLGHSTDQRRWTAYNDLYYYELSSRGRLVVTALRNHAFPMLRIETEDEARLPDEHHVELVRLTD